MCKVNKQLKVYTNRQSIDRQSQGNNHIAGKDQYQTKLTYILLIWFGLTLENSANRSLFLHLADVQWTHTELSRRELGDGPSSRFWWNVNWCSAIQWAWLSIKKYDECCLFIPVICPAVDGQPTTLPVSQSHSMRHAWHRKLADLPFVIGLFVNTTFIHTYMAGRQPAQSSCSCMYGMRNQL